MEEAMAAIRRAITDEEAGEMTLAPVEPRSFGEKNGCETRGWLSPKATAAIGSAFNTLTRSL
jgi:hypothetical protein